MLGFEITGWDYLTFLTLVLIGVIFLGVIVWFAGLPGRIAIARNHPEAEAVKIMGYAGLFPTIYPWVQAFIWAFKPTDVVDIRRFPAEQARETEQDIIRLKGEKTSPAPASPPDSENRPPESPLT